MKLSAETLETFRTSSLPNLYYVPEYLSEAEEAFLLDRVNNFPGAKWTQLKRRRVQNWGGVVHPKGMVPAPLPDWMKALLSRLYEDTSIFDKPLNHVLVNEYKPGEGILPHEDGPLYFPAVAILSLSSSVVIRFTPKVAAAAGPGEPPSAAAGPGEPPSAAAGPGEPPSAAAGPGEPPSAAGSGSSGAGAAAGPGASSEAPLDGPAEAPRSPAAEQGGVSLVLRPRSLLLFREDAYTQCLHGIEEAAEDRLDATLANRRAAGVADDACVLAREHTRVSMTCRTVLKTLNVSKLLPGLMKGR